MQPFLKYVAVVTIVAPLLAASGHYTSAKQSQAKIISDTRELDSVSRFTPSVDTKQDLSPELKADQKNESANKSDTVPESPVAVAPQPLQQNEIEPQIEDDSVSPLVADTARSSDPLAAVELAPEVNDSNSVSQKVRAGQLALVQRLKAAKIQSASKGTETPEEHTDQILQAKGLQTNSTAIPVPDEAQQHPDPIGSPHPIPWTWIQATQEAISSKGGSGVRYYRSVPVISPDGRYAIYSRVQLEVRPEMHNSRVTSVLFVEDRQTKKLQIISSTAPINDPLLKVKLSSPQQNTQGTIAVLVPVSWSENGDRFLARKFEGLMNTSDATDRAVIWDRQKNHSQSVTPAEEKHEHEEIAVLLGWSKARPDQVLFRTGEIGEDKWPLVTVSHDGSTQLATTADQPVTFGEKIKEVWAGPPVAYR